LFTINTNYLFEIVKKIVCNKNNKKNLKDGDIITSIFTSKLIQIKRVQGNCIDYIL